MLLSLQSPILVARNLPYTLVRDMFPDKDVSEQPITPILLVEDKPVYTVSGGDDGASFSLSAVNGSPRFNVEKDKTVFG